MDKVGRGEHKELTSQGDETLKSSRQMWLCDVERLDDDRNDQLKELQQSASKTGRAWAIRENFRYFWDYGYADNAEKFFKRWYGWAIRSRLWLEKKDEKIYCLVEGGWS